MRHRNSGRSLSRNASHRRALMRNMVTSLILEGRVVTTDAKAKELRKHADRMITLGKAQTLSARRRARSFIQTDEALKKLFDEVAPRFRERQGGYTRIIKLGSRRGDAAACSIIELTELPARTTRDRADTAEPAA